MKEHSKHFFRNLKPNHIIEISSNLQYAFLVVLEAFWMAGLVFFSFFFSKKNINYFRFRVDPDVFDQVLEEYSVMEEWELIREMVCVKKCEINSLQEIARNAVRKNLKSKAKNLESKFQFSRHIFCWYSEKLCIMS